MSDGMKRGQHRKHCYRETETAKRGSVNGHLRRLRASGGDLLVPQISNGWRIRRTNLAAVVHDRVKSPMPGHRTKKASEAACAPGLTSSTPSLTQGSPVGLLPKPIKLQRGPGGFRLKLEEARKTPVELLAGQAAAAGLHGQDGLGRLPG
jgi:hypothetical protein